MYTVMIHPENKIPDELEHLVDFVFIDLKSFADDIARMNEQRQI
jgi:pyruvate-formate lyase-activating enzyme